MCTIQIIYKDKQLILFSEGSSFLLIDDLSVSGKEGPPPRGESRTVLDRATWEMDSYRVERVTSFRPVGVSVGSTPLLGLPTLPDTTTTVVTSSAWSTCSTTSVSTSPDLVGPLRERQLC